MIKRPSNWDSVRATAERLQLPKGGYIIKILNAEIKTFDKNGDSFEKLEVSFDIAEGDYKDFYANNYRSQPQEDRKWKGVNRNIYIPKGNANKKEADTESHFKAMYTAIEESNAGYHFDWDEAHMKGKIVGCLFRLEEWSMNGNTGFSTQAAYFVSADNIRKGKFKLPKDKFLSNGAVSYSEPDDFQETPSSDDDLPF